MAKFGAIVNYFKWMINEVVLIRRAIETNNQDRYKYPFLETDWQSRMVGANDK